MAKLNFMDRENVLREFEITEDVITIGREANNKLVIADSSVSRLHALLEKREDGYYLVDKNSSNGSFINGKKITQQKLNHTDKVSLGNASLVFEDESQLQATFILQRPPGDLTVEDRPTEAVAVPPKTPPPSVPIRPTSPPVPPPTPAPAVLKTPPPVPPPPVAPPPPKVEAAPSICPACKKPVEPKAKFCGFCGAVIGGAKPADVPKPAAVIPPPPPSPVKAPAAPAPPPPRPVPPAPSVSSAPAGGLVYATFGQRVIAYLIDVLIVSALCLIPYGIMLVSFLLPLQRQEEPGPMAAVISVICMLVVLLIQVGYFVYFIGMKGATPGKKIMKLKVTLPDGQYPIGIGKGLVRFIGYMISAAICYIGFLMPLFDKEEHRALHDRIAGTRVIKEA